MPDPLLRTRTTISIVTPCYNEEAGIAACHAAVREVMETLPHYDYEHIFIDNCSRDRTVGILRAIAESDRRVKIIVNARNFGPERSPYHAMLATDSDIVVPVLADLQTPPEVIPRMIALWENGAKVVTAVKTAADESLPWKFARRLYYAAVSRLSNGEHIPHYMGFGLYDRCVIDALRELNEPNPYFRGLISEIGFERATLPYEQPPRLHGRSSYTTASLANHALLGLSTASRAPLRLMILVGFATSCLSFVFGLGYLIAKLVFWDAVPAGVAPLLIAMFFLGSMQLFALGIVGEYIGLLLNYARRFPLVIEKERINFDR